MISQLVDVLIPGGDGWPSASLAGTHGLLGFRLQEVRGEDAVRDLARAVDACGGDGPPPRAAPRGAPGGGRAGGGPRPLGPARPPPPPPPAPGPAAGPRHPPPGRAGPPP